MGIDEFGIGHFGGGREGREGTRRRRAKGFSEKTKHGFEGWIATIMACEGFSAILFSSSSCEDFSDPASVWR